jgi:hypothetical protein
MGKADINFLGYLLNAMISFQQFQKVPNTGCNINLAVVVQVGIALTFQAEIVFVAVFVGGMLGEETVGVGVDLD